MVKIEELFSRIPNILEPLFRGALYPWEILPAIKGYIEALLENPPKGYTLYSDGVLVGEGVKIADSAEIIPPAVIGAGTEIRQGAYLRGCVITGERCVIGNSTEVKNSVLFDRVQIPHYNYVGDSILGNLSHMGAGSVCSNLKNDGTTVTVRGEKKYETGLRKLGAILADGVNVGCGCVLNPGTVIGKGTDVYPLLSLRGVLPEDSIVKTPSDIVRKSERE